LNDRNIVLLTDCQDIFEKNI